MAAVKFPLSGDVAQSIWTAFLSPFKNQVGLINISLGESSAPDVEREVLDEVASYGKQLGRIEDAVAVLIKYVVLPAEIPETETKAIYALKIMLDEIADVKERHKRQALRA